jgi:3-oxoacyl-[acyl-carrier-protein] synthase-3
VKHLSESPASRLQTAFGLKDAAVVGITQQGCTGMLGAIRVAKSMLADDPSLRRALCVTSDRFPEGALYEQSYSLISDGATACIVSPDEGTYRIISSHAFTVGGRGAANDDEMVGAFFNQTHRLIVDSLAKARLELGQIGRLVPQNASPKAWQVLARLLRVDDGLFFRGTVSSVGHAIGSDCILNLMELERVSPVRSGEKVLVFVSGTGMNWQSLILEKT